MKYFVVADVHGFFTEMMDALNKNGFDINNENHKLIVCGDLMDRGREALKMQSFILDLLDKNKVILIRGNHEDLVLDMIEGFETYSYYLFRTHHYSNGTVSSAEQLTGMLDIDMMSSPAELSKRMHETPFVKRIIPATINYFETEHYIFVHGWIPCKTQLNLPVKCSDRTYSYDPDWRNALFPYWDLARWFNGMDVAHNWKVIEPGKTIVCGHYHCSWGWSHIKQDRKEFPNPNRKDWQKSFEPYTEEGIIAIDACTAYSGIVNCIVIEDNELEEHNDTN